MTRWDEKNNKGDKEGKSLPWKEEEQRNAPVRRRQLWDKVDEENNMKMEKRAIHLLLHCPCYHASEVTVL